MKPSHRVTRLRESGHVTRAHTIPHNGSYNVAQHSWHATALLITLHPDPSKVLIQAVLFHDVGERYVGDVPAPAKWDSPAFALEHGLVEDKVLKDVYGVDLSLLTEEEQRWLKAVDYLEFYLWCEDQLAMGNQNVKHARRNIREALEKMSLPPEAQQFFRNHQWERSPDRIP